MKRIINKDCKYFLGYKPCIYHKKELILCEDCPHYEKRGKKILIIKLGAMGDILRNTFILPYLCEKYENCLISWIVDPGSSAILKNIPEIHRIYELNAESLAILAAQEFDLILSLDSAISGGALCNILKAPDKKGFGLDENGNLYPLDNSGEYWYLTSIFDDYKKSNQGTYQELCGPILGIEPEIRAKGDIQSPGYRPAVYKYRSKIVLSYEELQFGAHFSTGKKIEKNKILIGLNTGAGPRWEMKKWSKEGFLGLIDRLAQDENVQIMLLGGPSEIERNQWLIENSSHKLIDGGCKNSIREFFAILNLCDLIVTADSFALHASLALGKKTVSFFGPSSAAEIDDYGLGKRIVAPVDCNCCYKMQCDIRPSCIELLSADDIYRGIVELLG